jgi:hypothetical protein
VIPRPAEDALSRITALLVQGDLEEIKRIGQSGRIDGAEWQARLNEYGRTLVMPPKGDFETADVVPISGKQPQSWSVRLPTMDQRGRQV